MFSLCFVEFSFQASDVLSLTTIALETRKNPPTCVRWYECKRFVTFVVCSVEKT